MCDVINVVTIGSNRDTIGLVCESQTFFNENSTLLAYLVTSGVMPGRLCKVNSSDELPLTRSWYCFVVNDFASKALLLRIVTHC